MTKIHGIVYIIVGAIISLVSWKVDFDDLMVFFYAGILFGIIGFFKIFLGIAKKNEDEKIQNKKNVQNMTHERKPSAAVQHHSAHIQHAQHSQVPHSKQTHQKQFHQAAQQYKRCQNCGNAARIHDNFCSRCGYNV